HVFTPATREALSEAGGLARRRGVARAARAPVAGQRPRAGSRARAGRLDGARRDARGGGPGPAPRGHRGAGAGTDDAGRGRARAHPEGAGAARRHRERGGQDAGAVAQRALSPARAPRPVEMPGGRRRGMRWETQLLLWVLGGGLPALILASVWLSRADMDPSLRGLALTGLWLVWLGCAGGAPGRAGRPLDERSHQVAAAP